MAAGETFGEHLWASTTDHLLELRHEDRDRIFNLGYFTWVEQQGVSLEDFNARGAAVVLERHAGGRPVWDAMIDEFNAKTGVLERL